MELGRNHDGNDRAGDCADNADGYTRNKTHEKDQRERIGKLSIGTLNSGHYRKLTEKEVNYLKSL